MKIEVKQVPSTYEVTVTVKHQHTPFCIEIDTVDLGDDGDGNYEAYDIYVCKVTGEEHSHLWQFGLDEGDRS